MGQLSRRTVLEFLAAGAALPLFSACAKGEAKGKAYPFSLTDDQWRARLTSQEYRILREAGTERAFTSPLDKEKRKGTFLCAGCAHPLFSSRTKFDSRTGWPSFYAPLKGGVGTSTDYKLGYPRTEVHCANCGGHLGHVFDDGPPPTGKRYCMNGVAMDFRPA
ncbi:peptide-methionine (R)-S-oxide reductase MsrB [Croceicoccus bisphenolivorans]|uniref:peptide-methionine (R)-S-oxide reductase MsrB n=1 Tax=Croceicoccus bisphenolivorans TaxID=1783232 RepID=UPI000831CFB4|nr:peptide-methionine (R)-S-oxide reductase MsrB [Croceicoccus bisphenolivorans]